MHTHSVLYVLLLLLVIYDTDSADIWRVGLAKIRLTLEFVVFYSSACARQ